jgi:hypothetical protein
LEEIAAAPVKKTETNDRGGSVALTPQHRLSAKDGITSPTKRRLLNQHSSIADQSNGVFFNCHVWCDNNPYAIHEPLHQQRFSLNVWVGILGDRLTGPHILPNKLTGKRYRRFLRSIFPGLLEDVLLKQNQKMWIMHDGPPAHFARVVRRHLTRRYCRAYGDYIRRGLD